MQTLQQLEFLRLAGKSKKKKPEAPECSLTNCKEERAVMRKVVDRLREK